MSDLDIYNMLCMNPVPPYGYIQPIVETTHQLPSMSTVIKAVFVINGLLLVGASVAMSFYHVKVIATYTTFISGLVLILIPALSALLDAYRGVGMINIRIVPN